MKIQGHYLEGLNCYTNSNMIMKRNVYKTKKKKKEPLSVSLNKNAM